MSRLYSRVDHYIYAVSSPGYLGFELKFYATREDAVRDMQFNSPRDIPIQKIPCDSGIRMSLSSPSRA